jgi:2-polyprenyl-3-methyl-5-hydroxy-6-metoxy-1,4-benzoquinol methylase
MFTKQYTQEALNAFYEESEAMEDWSQIKDTAHEDQRQGAKFVNVWRYIHDNNIRSVLDVGCGNGFFLNHVKLGLERVGIEPSETARQKCEYPVYRDNNEFEESLHSALRFDMLTFFGVLEHVKDPIELLKGYSQYLKSDGRIGIIVPNVDSLLVQTLGHEAATFCPQHLWYFNIKTLNKLMAKAGFEPDEYLTVEPETQPILKKLRGFKPYDDIGITLTDQDINDMSILANKKGYKITAFYRRKHG